MSRPLLSPIVVALVVSPADAAPKLKDRPKAAPSILGEWEAVTVKSGRATVQYFPGLGFRFTFEPGGRVMVNGFARGDQEWGYDAGRGADSCPLDLTTESGCGPGIYRIESDTLTLCFGPVGGDRPTEFAVPPRSGVVLMTLTRVKK